MAKMAMGSVQLGKNVTRVLNSEIPGQVRRDSRKWWQVRARGDKSGKLDTTMLPR